MPKIHISVLVSQKIAVALATFGGGAMVSAIGPAFDDLGSSSVQHLLLSISCQPKGHK